MIHDVDGRDKPGHDGNGAVISAILLWWLRAVDLSAVIDALLDDKTLGGQIDPAMTV